MCTLMPNSKQLSQLMCTLMPNSIPLGVKPFVSKKLTVKSKYNEQRNLLTSGLNWVEM